MQSFARVLALWKRSYLVFDNVELTLHPLTSELVHPIGPEQALHLTPQRTVSRTERSRRPVRFTQRLTDAAAAMLSVQLIACCAPCLIGVHRQILL